MGGDMTGAGESHDSRQQFRLFSAGAIGMSTLIGSPLAGGILMALNYARLGQQLRAKAAITLSLGAVFLFVALTVSTSADNPLPGLVYLFVLPPALYSIARLLQSRDVRAHTREGALLEPAWKAVGIALLTLSIIYPCAAIVEGWIR